MLDIETKRRIDTARDILVGKLPDPKSQVEQITIALIYKFMDDMDQESLAIGGKASFFTGEYAKYAWSSIFNPRLGGFDMLGLYAEAITSMDKNPALPQLFRDIFKNAYLPYRDPETLRLFLKTINDFSYDRTGHLGDAFEYLLSVLGSQGDAGQFLTPRHLIDFMVSVVQPQKNETILDPACGTAGFLISAFKYIQAANQKDQPGDLLTPDERQRLLTNFNGYDISPDMTRLSRVNLYLHGFVQPQIYEYDTLTSEERWNDYADVILANPPFMSPTGGIRPHKHFSVQSNRSEVLFVDYIAEHLTPAGRAAVIVPEGIIFQSANAYKQLRKYLVEKNYLWAVVSLPAGVFNPYSGVKTSILFIDKALAKKTDKILFVKVTADGFDLGAQRRQTEKNDLPAACEAMTTWQKAVQDGMPETFDPSAQSCPALLVETDRLAENGDFNLSPDRYRDIARTAKQKWPIVHLGEVCEVISGQSPEGIFYNSAGDGTPFYQGKTEFTEKYLGEPTKWTTKTTKIAEKNDILMSVRAPVGPVNIATQQICIGRGLTAIRPDESRLLMEFLFNYLRIKESEIIGNSGAVFPSINHDEIATIEIPLPPLDVQRHIVEEIAACQRIIDGARQVVEGWKPYFTVELNEALPEGIAEWEKIKLDDALNFVGSGVTPLGGKETYVEKGILFIRSQNVLWGSCDFSDAAFITEEIHQQMNRTHVKRNDVLLNITGASIGRCAVYTEDREANVNQHVTILRCKENLEPFFLMNYLLDKSGQDQIWSVQAGASRQALNYQQIRAFKIPLPPIEVQRAIVDRLETERRIVEGNRQLIQIYEEKIKKIIGRVWEG